MITNCSLCQRRCVVAPIESAPARINSAVLLRGRAICAGCSSEVNARFAAALREGLRTPPAPNTPDGAAC